MTSKRKNLMICEKDSVNFPVCNSFISFLYRYYHFVVDYDAIMEERRLQAEEEERQRKELEMKVNFHVACAVSDNLSFRHTMRLLFKLSSDHTKCENY